MESTGSVVVDFGRFCTAFLVVMGVGMLDSPLSRLCSFIWQRRMTFEFVGGLCAIVITRKFLG